MHMIAVAQLRGSEGQLLHPQHRQPILPGVTTIKSGSVSDQMHWRAVRKQPKFVVGGLGFRSVAEATHWASWADTVKMVRRNHHASSGRA